MRFDTVVNNANIILLFSLLRFRFDIHLPFHHPIFIRRFIFCHEFGASLSLSRWVFHSHSEKFYTHIPVTSICWTRKVYFVRSLEIWKQLCSVDAVRATFNLSKLERKETRAYSARMHTHKHTSQKSHRIGSNSVKVWDIKKSFFM